MADPTDRDAPAASRPAVVQPVEEIEFRPARRSDGSGRRRRLFVGGAVVAVVAALGVGLWFVFTARSVEIAVEPQPDTLFFASSGLQFRVGERYLTRTGTARVRAELAGYFPLDETVDVTRESSQLFEFTLRKKPGRVTLLFDPPVNDPAVVIDDSDWTPPVGVLDAGRHEIRVEAARFQPLLSEFVVEGGGVEQDVTLSMLPNWADVTFESLPAGADVVIDDEVRGQTPVTLEVLAGDHAVSVRARGYKAWRRPLQSVANVPQAFTDITLAKADGLLTVASAPAQAAVSVDGRFRGQTPLDLRLPPDRSYTVRVTKAGFGAVSRRVAIRSDEDQDLRVRLLPQVGELRFDLGPADAQVLIDGQPQVLTDRRLTLPAVRQTIEIRAAGYVSQTRSLTPNPGYSQDVKVRLLTIAAAREAAIKKTLTTGAGQVLRLMRPRPFEMGASRRERGRRANEALREVDSLKEFYIAEKEVTNREFAAFKADHDSGSVYSADLTGPDLPVVNVSWQDAAGYCNWLSEKDGKMPVYVERDGRLRASAANGYRLPTEAEWAWAARFAAGQGGPRFPWGQALPPAPDGGNYADRSAVGLTARTLKEYNDGYAATAPVGQFDPNAAGLYDIGGNVSEWTQDEYTVGQSGLIDEGGELYYVVRGSSWMHAGISELRLTFRDFSDKKRPDIGFRLALSLEEPKL